jgi:hypothetical protein
MEIEAAVVNPVIATLLDVIVELGAAFALGAK